MIPSGTSIHEAPCIRGVKKEYENSMCHTVLEHYLFNVASGDKLLALGYGSLFNHSGHPNVDYHVDAANLCIRYLSGHNIQTNKELCISYVENLWFEDASSWSQESSEAEPETLEGISYFLNNIAL